MIYLDNAATTPIDPEVLDAMLPYLKENYGNAGSIHSLGRASRRAIDIAREQTASLLNCRPEEIVFTSGGTEANNLAVLGISEILRRREMTHIVTMETEHISVYSPIRHLTGFHVTYIPVSEQGRVDIDMIRDAIKQNTGLVCIMGENNETGVRNPIKEIGDICLDCGSNPYFHSDCVQAAANSVIDTSVLYADTISISGHKIGGPKGVGALYVRDLDTTSELQPIIFGGDGQEFGIRGGTENVAGIVGFGKACELAKYNRYDENIYSDQLRSYFHNQLESFLYYNDLLDIYHINASNGRIANIRFDGIDAETLILALDARGICISAGAACHAGSSEPSRALKAIGLTEHEVRNSVRVSFSTGLSTNDVLRAAKIMAETIKILHEGV